MERERMPHLAKPKPTRRGSGKILLLLLVLLAAILLILFLRSDMSKIADIRITGNKHTTLAEVGQAIGVGEGDSFFAVSARTLHDRLAALPHVSEATAVKQFPGRIVIELAEYPEVAYLLGADGRLQTLLANGLAVAMPAGEPVRNLPILSGWEEGSQLLEQMAAVLAELPPPLLADISQIKPEPADAWPDRIRMYTRSYFEVVTTIGYLPERLDYMRAIIGDYEPGIITMLEANTHRPYGTDGESAGNGRETPEKEGI